MIVKYNFLLFINIYNKNIYYNMKKQIIRLTESDLHKIIENTVKRVIKEDFNDDYNTAMDKHLSKGGMWGMEAKNNEGDWEYGEVTFDPNSNTMSCMGASIEVDTDLSVDENLQALADELQNNGYDFGE